MITINLELAKNIWKNKLRQLRSPILNSLDILFLKSLETGDVEEQQRISNLKQLLRDITTDPRIENAQSVEELLNINPIKELGL